MLTLSRRDLYDLSGKSSECVQLLSSVHGTLKQMSAVWPSNNNNNDKW